MVLCWCWCWCWTLLPLLPQLLVAQRVVIHSTNLASNQLTSGICKQPSDQSQDSSNGCLTALPLFLSVPSSAPTTVYFPVHVCPHFIPPPSSALLLLLAFLDCSHKRCYCTLTNQSSQPYHNISQHIPRFCAQCLLFVYFVMYLD